MTTIKDIAAGERQYHVLQRVMPFSWVMTRLGPEEQDVADPYALVDLSGRDMRDLRERVAHLMDSTMKQPMGTGRGSTTRKREFPRDVVESVLARLDDAIEAHR